jgi:predicted Zn-dependent peptidase
MRVADAAFGAMPRGQQNQVDPPSYLGGVRTRALAGCPQTHVVLGFPLPSLGGAHQAGVVAAALLGEGMSSPLMDQLRERRGLVYYAACSADVLELAGQFVIEASTSPQHLQPFFAEVVRLLLEHAQVVDVAALQRARQQIAVRHLRDLEKPSRRLETAALDLFALGRVRTRAETLQALQDVSAEQVRECFGAMLRAGAAVAVAGKLRRGADALLREWSSPLLQA